MSKTTLFSNEFLLHIFNNAAITLIGDAAGLLPSAVAGSLYLSLHSANPGVAGDQTTSELAYTSYVRLAVARSAVGFAVSAATVSPGSGGDWVFATSTGGAPTVATYLGFGASSSGAGKLLYRGSLVPSISIATGSVARITTQSLIIES